MRSQCTNFQSELGKAIISYEMSKQRVPGVMNWVNPQDINSLKTNWIIAIFDNLAEAICQRVERRCQTNLLPVQVDQFVCPSNKQIAVPGGLSYVVNLGVYQMVGDPAMPDYSVRMFRDRTRPSNSYPEPDFSFVSLKTASRSVLLSEKLNAGPWNTVTGQATPGYAPNPLFSALAFQWPNQFADYPTNSVPTSCTIGTDYAGDPGACSNSNRR